MMGCGVLNSRRRSIGGIRAAVISITLETVRSWVSVARELLCQDNCPDVTIELRQNAKRVGVSGGLSHTVEDYIIQNKIDLARRTARRCFHFHCTIHPTSSANLPTMVPVPPFAIYLSRGLIPSRARERVRRSHNTLVAALVMSFNNLFILGRRIRARRRASLPSHDDAGLDLVDVGAGVDVFDDETHGGCDVYFLEYLIDDKVSLSGVFWYLMDGIERSMEML